MEKNKVIVNEYTGEYLAALFLGRTGATKPVVWTRYKNQAIHFENAEEAKATIEFIGAVIDWELEECLEIVN